jgi:hypothetical protein
MKYAYIVSQGTPGYMRDIVYTAKTKKEAESIALDMADQLRDWIDQGEWNKDNPKPRLYGDKHNGYTLDKGPGTPDEVITIERVPASEIELYREE